MSAAGLVGGANPPQPGEATLAHRGVLFLDELSEFARPSLEALRQPLEDGHVTIVRGQQVDGLPDPLHARRRLEPVPVRPRRHALPVPPVDLARHRRRLSGPLLDRIDILMRVERPPAEALRRQAAPPRPRSANASSPPASASCASRRPARDLQRPAHLAPDPRGRPDRPSALRLLGELYDRHTLSARGHTRILRVARTVADLDASSRRPRARRHAAEPAPRRLAPLAEAA